MIAANHPALGMNPNQSGADYSDTLDDRRAISFAAPRPIRSVPIPAPAPPAVNQISPAPAPAPAPPQVLVRISPSVYTEAPNPAPTVPTSTAIVTPEVPASASATGSAAPAAAGNTFDEFFNWLTEETIYSGVPNGAFLAGGLVFASWLFGGGKKGRR